MSTFTHARALASSRRPSEDRAEVFERGDALVVVVADGAGGQVGGAAASDAFVLVVTTAAASPTLDLESSETWKCIFTKTDAELATKMTGETTAIVVIVSPRGLLGVSAGDSEAWVIRATGIDDLTEGQTKKRPGSGRALPTTVFRSSLDGILVVGTDGLFKYAAAENIAEAVRAGGPQEVADKLVELVRLPSGLFQDDVAVVVSVPSGTN